MIDQATELRKLVLRSMRESTASAAPPPRLLAVTGGSSGVGVTTIAVNLAVAFAEQGSRVVIVDADLHRADVAALCGLGGHPGLADVLVSRRDIHEVLQRGPAGIQVVPGSPGGLKADDLARERLLRQLKALGRHADTVILDLGSGVHEQLVPLCAAADDILLVTTPQNSAVMEAYTRVKLAFHDLEPAALELVLNLVETAEQAEDVHRRINQSCHRFLNRSLQLMGFLPPDEAIPAAAVTALPVVLGQPKSPAAESLERLAVTLAVLARHRGASRPVSASA